MFHQRDGLYFERQQDGAVRIIKTSDGLEPATANVLLDQTIAVSEFASVVASMSRDGEADGGYYRALEFLTLPWLGSHHTTLARSHSDPSKYAAFGHETGMGKVITDVTIERADASVLGRLGGHGRSYDAVTVEVEYRERAVKPIQVDDDD